MFASGGKFTLGTLDQMPHVPDLYISDAMFWLMNEATPVLKELHPQLRARLSAVLFFFTCPIRIRYLMMHWSRWSMNSRGQWFCRPSSS